jgi:hypothetical protein
MENSTTNYLDRPADQEKRSELRSKLPALALRVIALDGKHYNGCGFHYSLLKTIGGLLYRLNNFDARYTWHELMIDEVIYEDLYEQIGSIESRVAEQHLKVLESSTVEK